MDGLYVMNPLEVVWGSVMGHDGTLPAPSSSDLSPRTALEQIVRRALERPPCGVAFSGGRDSSLILAVATAVARRDGLPEPVPITRVFPDVPEADEHEWQEAVVRHLGVADWHRIELDDELDVVGPLAAAHLCEHGVLWPPTIAGDLPLVDAVPGGSVIDGEGGDEVLGFSAHRIAPVARFVRSPRPMRWRRLRSALGALAPPSVRSRHVRDTWERVPTPWLRPPAKESLGIALELAERARPLSFADSVRLVPLRRTQLLGGHNRHMLAAARGVEFSSPLLHPDFVHALARDGGVFGRGDRTAVLCSLAGDLLPHEVLARTHKADFTRCYMGRHTREFAARWTGDGIDHDLVDPEELRRAWLADPPPAPTAALAQAAWLASSSRSPSALRSTQRGIGVQHAIT